MDDLRKKCKQILEDLNKFTAEDEVMIQWKIAELNNDLNTVLYFVNDLKSTLNAHKKATLSSEKCNG